MSSQAHLSLPTGWDSDYDGVSQKWFYVYRPTGQTQFRFPKPGDHISQTIDAEQAQTPLVQELESVSISQPQESHQSGDTITDIKQPTPAKPAQQSVRRLSELARKPIPQPASPTMPQSTQSAQPSPSTSSPTLSHHDSSSIHVQQDYQPFQHSLSAVQIQQGYLPASASQIPNPVNNTNQFIAPQPSKSLQDSSPPPFAIDSTPIYVPTTSESSSSGQSNTQQPSVSGLQHVDMQSEGQVPGHNLNTQQHQTIGPQHLPQRSTPASTPPTQAYSLTSTTTPSLNPTHGYPPPPPPPLAPNSPHQSSPGHMTNFRLSYQSQNSVHNNVYADQNYQINHNQLHSSSPVVSHNMNPLQVLSPPPTSLQNLQHSSQIPPLSPASINTQAPHQSSIRNGIYFQPQMNQQSLNLQNPQSPAPQSISSSIPSQNSSHRYSLVPGPPVSTPLSNDIQTFGMPPGHPLIHAGIYIVYPKLPSRTQQTYTYQPLNQPQTLTPQSTQQKPQIYSNQLGHLNHHLHSIDNNNPRPSHAAYQPNQMSNQTSIQFEGRPQTSIHQGIANNTQFKYNFQGIQGAPNQQQGSPSVIYVQSSTGAITSTPPAGSQAPLNQTLNQIPIHSPHMSNIAHKNHLNQHCTVVNNVQAQQHLQNQVSVEAPVALNQGSAAYVQNQTQQTPGTAVLPQHTTSLQTSANNQSAQQQQYYIQDSQPAPQPVIQNQVQTVSVTTSNPTQQQQQQQQVGQTQVFSPPASLAARASRGDLPSKFVVGASNTANKAVSGAKNFFKGNSGKKAAVTGSGAVIEEALDMNAAQGANLANAGLNQYQNSQQNSGKPDTTHYSTASTGGGRLQHINTVHSGNTPAIGVNQLHSPGVVLSNGRPNNNADVLPPGNQPQASGRRPVNGRQSAPGTIESDGTIAFIDHLIHPGQVKQRPGYQQQQQQIPQNPQDQYYQPYQTDSQAYQQSQQSSDTTTILDQTDYSLSDVQDSQTQQFANNLASSQWDSISSTTGERPYSPSITPQPLFSNSDIQGQQTRDHKFASMSYEHPLNSNSGYTNLIDQPSNQIQPSLNDQSTTIINQSTIGNSNYEGGGSFMTSAPASPQPDVVYVQAQSSEQVQQSINDQSTTINQSVSNSNMYTNKSLDVASSQQAFIYENPQASDQLQQQTFSNQPTTTVISDNSYPFADRSSTQINALSTTYVQADSQVPVMIDTCYADDGSNIVPERSTNVDVDIDACTSQSANQAFVEESSVDETETYYQNDVNDDYNGDGGW